MKRCSFSVTTRTRSLRGTSEVHASVPGGFPTSTGNLPHSMVIPMKQLISFFVFTSIALVSVGSNAAAGGGQTDHSGHGAAHSIGTLPVSQPLVDGVIKRIDLSAGKVTVAHGPLPNGMPGMTMAFGVNRSVPIGEFKEGQKIRFAIADANGVMTIVRIEPAK